MESQTLATQGCEALTHPSIDPQDYIAEVNSILSKGPTSPQALNFLTTAYSRYEISTIKGLTERHQDSYPHFAKFALEIIKLKEMEAGD